MRWPGGRRRRSAGSFCDSWRALAGGYLIRTGIPATVCHTALARAAITWLTSPWRSANTTPRRVGGATPPPTSLATSTTGTFVAASASIRASTLQFRAPRAWSSNPVASLSPHSYMMLLIQIVRQSTNTAPTPDDWRRASARSSGASMVCQ